MSGAAVLQQAVLTNVNLRMRVATNMRPRCERAVWCGASNDELSQRDATALVGPYELAESAFGILLLNYRVAGLLPRHLADLAGVHVLHYHRLEG
jgi:hypothetical protein